MSRFFAYDPDQAYLLPPNVKDVLGTGHLCFHVRRVVEALDVSHFEKAYSEEGRLAYPPRMMLKVWLYAFCLQVTSTRRLEQRVKEDLAFRYLAGGLTPDHKTLSEFLRRHRYAINTVFTQVLEMARQAGMVRLGHVAIDSTRVKANASRWSVVNVDQTAREQRARDRRQARKFQRRASEPDPNEEGGVSLRMRRNRMRSSSLPDRCHSVEPGGHHPRQPFLSTDTQRSCRAWLNLDFCTLLDARRPDLLEDWFSILRCIRFANSSS
jgi:transposase